jgi:hypothetical protein
LLRDEAESSIEGSFMKAISATDQQDLIEDAKDRLLQWLEERRKAR